MSRVELPAGYRGTGEFWDLKDQYLSWMVATGYSPVTVKNIHADLSWLIKHFEKRGLSRIADVTPEVLDEYSLSLREPKNGLKPSLLHVNHRLITVKKFFKWLAKQATVLCDPAEDLELPKLPQNLPHTILTQEEAKRILEAPNLRSPVGYRDRALLELLYSTGVRSAELMRLKVEDVDEKALVIKVMEGKGRKDRVVPIPATPMRYVMEYVKKVRPQFAKNRKHDDGTLFLNWTGAKLDINRLCEIIRRNVKLAGIEKRITALTFRHSICSALLENGMSIREIAEVARHDRLQTTTVYAKVTLSGLRRHFSRTHPRERGARRKGRENDA